VLYSGDFAQRRPDMARRYMRAYLRAVRDYNGALADGKLAGPNAVNSVRMAIKNAAVYRAISPQGCNPDGYVNVASLRKDFAFYREQGWIEGKVTVDQVIDNSFVTAALRDLGPYRRPGR